MRLASWKASLVAVVALLGNVVLGEVAYAQQGTYDAGSNGSDGALTFAANAGTVDFDPASYTPRLDPDGDYVFHFTTITIPAGTTVRLRTRTFTEEGRPIVWLASGAVTIAGTLDLNGDAGHASGTNPIPAFAGAGGYNGGVGGTTSSGATPGNGPGGGLTDTNHGGHASFVILGAREDTNQSNPGATYGNVYLRPLIGGSGGGGGRAFGANGGGGGGGSGGGIVIASSTSIAIDGVVRAQGGSGGSSPNWWGGAGSGGAVRLIAPTLEGTGSVNVSGGVSHNSDVRASNGRIRFEYFRAPTALPTCAPAAALTRSAPSPVFPPTSAPLVKVKRIAGTNVNPNPTGSFNVPDAVIETAGPVTVEIETTNVPAGTVLQLTFQGENSSQTSASSTPVTVTSGVGSATATATFPAGYTRIFIRASWTP